MNRSIIALSNTGGEFFDIGQFVDVSAGDKYVFGFCARDLKNPLHIASYKNHEQCKYALGLLFAAMIADESWFEFPHCDDLQEMMEQARQHGSKITSRKRSHGGS